MQTYIKPIKQNNDHTRIVRNVRFRSSFKKTRAVMKELLGKVKLKSSYFPRKITVN